MNMIERYDQHALEQALTELRDRCAAIIKPGDSLIGIRQGGLLLARYLSDHLGHEQVIGQLDVNFYRDDFGRRQQRSVVKPSANLPRADGARIILIDDVLWTGRTVRAALNELFDFGRPDNVLLAVLFDRGGRELPISADIVGAAIELNPRQQIKLRDNEGRLYAEISEFSEPATARSAQK